MADPYQSPKSAASSRWAGFKSRTQKRIDNNLGIIASGHSGQYRRYRTEELNRLDLYLKNKQYDTLADWDGSPDEYVQIRKRKPRIILSFPKMLCSKVMSKLVGRKTFPKLAVEDDPDTTVFLELLLKHSHLKTYLQDTVRQMLGMGSCFLRFYMIEGQFKLESFNTKYCYPVFDDIGELEEIEVRYTYPDYEDRDANGAPKEKWFRMLLSKTVDILYDNPTATEAEPNFVEVQRAEHGFGFVQGEWFRTTEDKHSPDGYSLILDILDLCDELNYSMSQSSQAISYAQEPQLTIAGMDAADLDELIRSSTKAWSLGRDGKAEFLEANMTGVEAAQNMRDIVTKNVSDIARIVLLDPEKMVGSAQSGKAMEVLHGPLVELIDELRPMLEKSMLDIISRMTMAFLLSREAGALDLAIQTPPDWVPESMSITADWPPIFPMTMEDLQKKVAVAVQAGNASVVSRETLTRWVASDFGIENVEEEIAKIAAQPVINPFGAF